MIHTSQLKWKGKKRNNNSVSFTFLKINAMIFEFQHTWYSIDLNQIELNCNKSSANKMKADRSMIPFDDKIRGCGFCIQFYTNVCVCVCCCYCCAYKMHRIRTGWGSPQHNYFIALYILHTNADLLRVNIEMMKKKKINPKNQQTNERANQRIKNA